MYSTDLRVRAIRAYLKMRSFRKAAELLDVPKSTLHRWVHKLQRRRKTHHRKMTDTAISHIQHVLKQSCFTTPETLRRAIAVETSLRVSTSCVRFWMKRCGFTRKKPTRTIDRPGLHTERVAFAANHLGQISAGRVVSIDESSFYFDMKPTHGYGHRSCRLQMTSRPGGRTRWSLLLAVTNSSVVGWQLFKGSINSTIFASFIDGLATDGRDVLLMDNCAIHKTRLVRQVIERRNLTALFLPPYTPSFQPVEHAFSVLKNAYRRALHCQGNPSDEVMRERVAAAIQALHPTSLGSMFGACWQRGTELVATG